VAATFVNLSAAARRLATEDRVTIVCAGWGPCFSLEYFVCAGWLSRELRRLDPARLPDDGARAAESAATEHGQDLPRFLRSTDHGRRLIDLGLEPDLDLAAEVDRFQAVPELRDGRLTAHQA
jgi:phosphosulfolactate phosphohydrolase-like enzyme